MSDRQMERVISIEERLAGAAAFMGEHGIVAVLIDGRQDDGRGFEGVSFMQGVKEIGEVRFVGGEAVDASIEEQERRLAVAGFINGVVCPVQRAALSIYGQGGDLLDERFDVLPGFNS